MCKIKKTIKKTLVFKCKTYICNCSKAVIAATAWGLLLVAYSNNEGSEGDILQQPGGNNTWISLNNSPKTIYQNYNK